MHKDHLEWFDKKGDGQGAINLDATKNVAKSTAAQNRNLFGGKK